MAAITIQLANLVLLVDWWRIGLLEEGAAREAT